MTDLFGNWVRMQEQTLHAQRTAFDAAFKAMGSGVSFDHAAEAAKAIGEAQINAWQTWMAMWGGGAK